MQPEVKKQLVKEIIQVKFQEFNGNQDQFLEWLSEMALCSTEEINAALLEYAQAKKARIEAEKNALEAKKLEAEQQATQEINALEGVIEALG